MTWERRCKFFTLHLTFEDIDRNRLYVDKWLQSYSESIFASIV